ncbi:MAG: FMN-dependent NADH-azoreductase [Janthinobacterium lividum]
MASLLKIDVSPRGDASYSRQLGKTFADSWQAAHSGGNVVTRDLAVNQPTYVDVQWIAGAYSKPEDLTAEHKAALKLSDEIVAEVKAADTILITTPMYNFQVPAVLKAWIDHLVRAGVTFSASDQGYAGLIHGKKAVVIVTAAGAYDEGTPAAGYDLLTPYMKQILGFVGITESTVVKAGGTAGIQYGKISADDWKKPFEEQVKTLATA